MYNRTFYIPRNYNYIPSIQPQNIYPTRLGLMSKLSNTIKGIKNINWGGIINNTSKTLNVINQAIPIVRQVKPIVGNVKSMLKVASIFKDETDPINNKKEQNKTNNNANNNQTKEQEQQSPNFFIN